MFTVRSYKRKYLEMWNARMCRPNVEPLVDKVVVAVLKRQGFNDIDYIPRNIYDPQSLFDALEFYDPVKSHYVDFQDYRVKAGLGMAYKAFARPKHMPVLNAVKLDGPIWQVYDLLGIKGDKSAGLTAYGETKLEAFPVAMRKVGELLRDERRPDPCLAGTRTQAGKAGRLVWGYPLMMTIIEGCIARPLLDHFTSTGCTPMAFGKTSCELGIEMRKAKSHRRYYVSMDASKFDATVQAGVIKCAFNAVRTWFDPEQKVFGSITVAQVMDIIEDYFLHTPIVMPTQQGPTLYSGKKHGVPSGSYFTQFVDSFANVSMIGSLDSAFKLGIRLDEVFVLGDDMLFYTNKTPNLEKYAEVLSKLYHMILNSKKSRFGLTSEPIPFLGRVWRNGLPSRDFREAVARAVSPERHRQYGDDKTRGASAVLASYGLTAMLTGMPQNFDPYLNIVASRICKNSASGLTEFLLREGEISNRIVPKLY